jgi:hypothetical protein
VRPGLVLLVLAAVLGVACGKGGRLTVAAADAELAYQLAEGGIIVAEAFGDVLEAAAINEDGAEGFVLALLGAGGLDEEAAAEGIVHNGSVPM